MAAGTDQELAERLIENALEDCVSTFDGFGRELCRTHAHKSTSPNRGERISFQNLNGAKMHVLTAFGIDLTTCVTSTEWELAVRSFQKRHLFAHKMGVVDEDYIARTADPTAIVGRKITIEATHVREVVRVIRKVAQYLFEQLAEQ